ncbi:MAG: HigA family addiction module antidote protein [Spirochaetales bacterium]|nr:HigA family addiction module antidote protein [Spirochaetales bacterium]
MFTIEREPSSPGEILDEELLQPLHITQKQLADHLGCDVKVIDRIVNHGTSITAETAGRLASALGTSPEFWLSAQQAADLYYARKEVEGVPEPLVKTP